MQEISVVVARHGNAFFAELAEALRGEIEALGIPASLSENGVPSPESGRAYVLVAPHEYVALAGREALPPEVLERTVSICTEQPDNVWFEMGAAVARRSSGVLDINPRGVRALGDRGIRADHLQIGYTRRWDRFDATPQRHVDLAFLGGATHRRTAWLASYAGRLWLWHCHFVIGDNLRPQDDTSPSWIAGEDKLDLLSRTRALLNLHRSDNRYFEWQRVVEAIHCGAAVVSEWSTDFEPLEPGTHFLSSRPQALHLVADEVLSDEPRRRELARQAYEFLRQEVPLRRSVERLVEHAEKASRPRRRRLRRSRIPEGPTREMPIRKMLRRLRPRPNLRDLRRELKKVHLEIIDTRRRLDEIAETQRRGAPPPEVEFDLVTPAYRTASPRVTVVTALWNDQLFVSDALNSAATSRNEDIELVVVDDGSTDDSRPVVRGWLEENENVPGMLLHHPVNRGLPVARNVGIEHARGEYVLILDSDNVLYPHCVERLVGALDGDPGAAFAYGILEAFDEDGPKDLMGYWGWQPERLTDRNYIDALALLRRSAVLEVGGFTTDRRLYGWEDYDLWCSFAERGWHAAHVREILARYRLSENSMISLANMHQEEPREALVERHLRLFSGVHGIAPNGQAGPWD